MHLGQGKEEEGTGLFSLLVVVLAKAWSSGLPVSAQKDLIRFPPNLSSPKKTKQKQAFYRKELTLKTPPLQTRR